MAKTLTIKFEEKEYVLEFTRKSVERMEKEGFVADEIAKKPMSTLPVLFKGAFYAHHRFVPDEVKDAIFACIPNKSDFLTKLAEMYNEPIEALMAEPEGPEEGNALWEASW